MVQMNKTESKRATFQIEAVLPKLRVLFLRRVNKAEFSLQKGATINGYMVENFHIPRKLNPDGSPDLELFCFVLATRPDEAMFPVGSIVEYVER